MTAVMLPRRSAHAPPRNSGRVWWNRSVAVGGAVLAVMLLAGAVGVIRPKAAGERAAIISPPSTMARAIGTDSTPTSGLAVASTSGNRPASSTGGRSVTLAFGGDVHFEGRIGARLQTDPSAVLAGVAPILRAADVAVVNLETAITSRGTRPPGKEYAFRAPALAFAALQAGGVDVASMANNHGMDYGEQGLEDSLEAAAAAGFPVVGIGRDATEAYRPHVSEAHGQRIAVFGATQVLDGDLEAAWTATDARPGLASAKDVSPLTNAVRAIRSTVDTVVVYLHWGSEGDTCPNGVQPGLARALVDAGADVIVGGHSHRLQGAGRMGSAFVAYGLGNFVFYSDTGPGTETGVLTVTVTGRRIDRYEWTPGRLVGQLPRFLQDAAATQALQAWEALRGCTGLAS